MKPSPPRKIVVAPKGSKEVEVQAQSTSAMPASPPIKPLVLNVNSKLLNIALEDRGGVQSPKPIKK